MSVDSVLNTIKKLIGGMSEDNDTFDVDLITHINTYFGVLNQLGVGPVDGFAIHDSTAVWADYLVATKYAEAIRTYIYLRVKLIFDPPQTSALLTAMKQEADQLEWRLSAAASETVVQRSDNPTT